MSKRFKAAIIGATGYGGAEMIRRLLIHPEVELCRVVAKDHVGETLGQVHLNFTGAARHLTIQDLTPVQAAEGCDVVLLGVPHKVAAHLVPELIPSGVKIVDMSGDFRLLDAAVYERYYGQKHPAPELLGRFVYGLPELNRERLRGAQWVASPGCFATCVELGLLPLIRAGLLPGPTVVHTQGLTGSSGSGIAPQAGTHHPTRAGNLRTYKPLDHQHVPEILMALEAAGARQLSLRFVPISAPLVRGMFVTSYLEVGADTGTAQVEDAFRQSFEGEPFVRLVKGRQPEAVAVAGSNHAEVGFALSPEVGPTGTRTLVVFSALDNLIKGGAGQAIQNMNLALGLPETLSLEDVGVLAVSGPENASGKGRRIVIKFGGEVVEGAELGHLCDDVRELSASGHRVALVHGGGRQMTELSEKLGLTTRIIAGRRVTDEPTLQVLKMVVAGRLAVDLCAALGARGVRAVALNGASGQAVRARRRPPKVLTGAEAEGPVDLGFVGDVTGFNLELVELLWGAGYVPALGCIGTDESGQVYNINADVVAGDLAAALQADQLLLVSTVPGVLADARDASTRLPRLSRTQGHQAIADGTVKGGMIPKLEEAFAALDRGVGEVHILGKLGPGDLRRASEEPGAVGTALLP